MELAVFCHFYLLSLDLLDDVQDDDLGGKPHAAVGSAMAVNDALTLLFLGLSALERGMRVGTRGGQRGHGPLSVYAVVALGLAGPPAPEVYWCVAM